VGFRREAEEKVGWGSESEEAEAITEQPQHACMPHSLSRALVGREGTVDEEELLTRRNERRAKEKRRRDVEPGRAERSVPLVILSLQRGSERLERCVERQEALSKNSRFLSLSLFTLSFKFDPVSLTGTAAIYSILQRPLNTTETPQSRSRGRSDPPTSSHPFFLLNRATPFKTAIE